LLLGYFAGDMPWKSSALVRDDSLRARRVFEEVPTDSPLWPMQNVHALNTISLLASAARDSEAVLAYLDRAFEAQRSPLLRAVFLYCALATANEMGADERAREYYVRLTVEHPETPFANWATDEFGPDRAIVAGKPIPDFAFPVLGRPDSTLTSAQLRGRVYLLDFWGTWCGPCIGEIEYLHRAYERFRKRGFEILSVALRDDSSAVQAFRRGRWPMPWLNALVEEGSELEREVLERFEVSGFPKPILVDEVGTIVATAQTGLRGTELEEVLSRLYKKRD
jgi:thiol-disulfide isomerase/thioredoxin